MNNNSTAGRVFDVFNIVFLIIIAIVTIYPFWYVTILSLTNVTKVSTSNLYLLPMFPTIDSYRVALTDNSLLRGILVSGGRVISGVFLCLVTNSMIAYVLSRPYFLLRKPLNFLVVLTMFVSGGLIPFYLVVKAMGLVNTFWALVIPFGFDPFGIILFKNYFRSMPSSIDESAKIDGANDIVIFFRIYVPLSLPIVATMILFWAVWFWNDFIWGQFLVMKNNLLPIQSVLYRIIMEAGNLGLMNKFKSRAPNVGADMESVKAASIILTTIPILIVYPFLQKYFVKGVMLGAVKE